MSFRFNWDFFNDEDFYDRVQTLLTDALNKGTNPPILADKIKVRELYLGDESPQLEILEVGDLAEDRFRGIFKLTYNGNASITLQTKIRANPLQVYAMSAPEFCLPNFHGAANGSLAIPLNITLSDIQLSGIIILVFSKAKGLTLVFRNDPLQSIRVTSTFDTLPGIARFLQVQIEKQIRSLFREDLPAILHKLSHRWTPSGSFVLEKQKLIEHQQKQKLHNNINMDEKNSNVHSESVSEDSNHFHYPPHLYPTVDDNDDTTQQSKEPEFVSFADINPEMPALSPSNMLKLNTLCASQQTLSLFTPVIPEAVYRANLEAYHDPRAKSHIQNLEGNVDLDEIARIQSKNYFRNSHTKPKRRVIKLNNKSQASSTEASSSSSSSNSAAVSVGKESVAVSNTTPSLVPIKTREAKKSSTAATIPLKPEYTQEPHAHFDLPAYHSSASSNTSNEAISPEKNIKNSRNASATYSAMEKQSTAKPESGTAATPRQKKNSKQTPKLKISTLATLTTTPENKFSNPLIRDEKNALKILYNKTISSNTNSPMPVEEHAVYEKNSSSNKKKNNQSKPILSRLGEKRTVVVDDHFYHAPPPAYDA